MSAVRRRRGSTLNAAYQGADIGRQALKAWDATIGSADSDTASDLPTLRAHSSDLVRNQPLAAGAISTHVTAAVGTGLRLRASIDHEALGLTEEEAEAWQRLAERIFVTAAQQLDLERTLTFMELQDLAMRAPLERGDVFFVRRYQKNPGDLLGLKLQTIEADRVANPRGRFDSSSLRQGVEIDPATGAPVAYHVADQHPGELRMLGPTQWKRVPAFGQSGERLVLHLFRKLRPGLTRGVPMLAPVIEHFKQLSRLSEAEIMAAVINAMFTVIVEEADEDDVGPLAPVPGDSAADADSGEYELGHGSVVSVPKGGGIHFADPKRPNPNLGGFIDTILMQVGVGIGLPFEVMTKRFQSSYSAARAALLEFWREVWREREWLADKFCRPVYALVIAEAVSLGLLDAPGFFSDPLRRAAWLSSEWIGDSPGQLDEFKEAKAAELRIATGLSTESEETAALTGGDWDRNIRQRARELRIRRELKIDTAARDEETDPDPTQDPDKED